MHRLLLVLTLAWAAAGLVACRPDCGPGTHLEGHTCVADPVDAGGSGYSCGPGTHESGGVCVPDGTDGGGGGTPDGGGGGALSCGPGTHVEGTLCLPGDPIDSIELSPMSASVSPGQTQTFTAVAKSQGTVVSGVDFDWSTSSPATATINGAGVATALASGSTRITASARGVTSAAATLTVTSGPAARLTSLSPTSAPPGAPITLSGSRFGLTQGTTQVLFGTSAATSVLSWSDTRIVVRVPVDLTPGTVDVKLEFPSGGTNTLPFTVTSGTYVISVSPDKAVQGSKVTLFLSGTNLGSCSVALNRGGVADSSITVDNVGKVVERAGAPGLPDLVRVNVDVGGTTAVGELAVSCGASTTALTQDNRFSVTYRAGTLTAAVGSGTVGFGGDGGPASSAKLNNPSALALGNSGELYIADTGNHRIRVANPTSGPLTIAGLTVPAGGIASLAGGGGLPGDTDAGYVGDGGPAVSARLDTPSGLAYDARGLLFIADTGNHCLRVINVGTAAVTLPGGSVQPGAIALVAGAGRSPGYAGDGSAALPGSRFNGPAAVAVDGNGLLYVADTNNHRLRVVNASTGLVSNGLGTFEPGTVSLVAGSSVGTAGDNLPASNTTQLNAPSGLAFDTTTGLLSVADTGNNKVRIINTTPASLTFGGPPASAGGLGLALDSGYITTAVGAGGAAGFSGDGWTCPMTATYDGWASHYAGQQCARLATMAAPVGLSVGPFGQLFIADQNNGRVRLAIVGDAPLQRAEAWFYPGAVDTLAGNGTSTSGIGAGDGGPAKNASLFGPQGVAWSSANATLYVADTLHHRIRQVLLNLPREPFSGSSGPWPTDFTAGTATLDVDTGILSYNNGTGPAERRFGATGGVFAISGKLRLYPGTTLQLTGSRPAVLAATGDVQIDGILQVGNGALSAGPGLVENGGPGHGTQGPGGSPCGDSRKIYPGGYAYGSPSLVPVTPSTAGLNGAGALVLSAGVPGSSASLKLTGEIRADSGYNTSTCITGGSGGGVRLVATGQLSVTGTLTALPGNKPTCCTSSYRPAEQGAIGRLRLEAPVVTATGTVSPAASISTTLPLPPPWM